jgi:hypothetical protein
VTATLIAAAFIAFVASPVLAAIWPQRGSKAEASSRTVGRLSNFSAPRP